MAQKITIFAPNCKVDNPKTMASVRQFFKNWALPISMASGALAYFVFVALPIPAAVHVVTYTALSQYIQPTLIFCMLFLSFMKVRIADMRPQWWHLWVLILQAGWFILFSLLSMHCQHHGLKVLCEGAMLAFICPTATASAVITGKLGGSVPGVVTYLMFCNLMVSVVASAFLPLVEPQEGLNFITSFYMIIGKVFPLLICPLLLAQLVRYLWPKAHRKLLAYPDLAFHIWVVSLALAITVTVRSIVHSSVDWRYMVALALISAVCCLSQFWMGKRVGARYDVGHPLRDSVRVTAGQAFGQKNTVFIIWLGLVFLDPVTSVVGGFYSLWHNLVNSWQLYKVRHRA